MIKVVYGSTKQKKIMEDLKIRNMSKSASGTIQEPGRKVAQKSGLNRSILDHGWESFVGSLSTNKDGEGEWWSMLTLSIRAKLVRYAAIKQKRIV
jgi:hypothetical protein